MEEENVTFLCCRASCPGSLANKRMIGWFSIFLVWMLWPEQPQHPSLTHINTNGARCSESRILLVGAAGSQREAKKVLPLFMKTYSKRGTRGGGASSRQFFSSPYAPEEASYSGSKWSVAGWTPVDLATESTARREEVSPVTEKEAEGSSGAESINDTGPREAWPGVSDSGQGSFGNPDTESEAAEDSQRRTATSDQRYAKKALSLSPASEGGFQATEGVGDDEGRDEVEEGEEEEEGKLIAEKGEEDSAAYVGKLTFKMENGRRAASPALSKTSTTSSRGQDQTPSESRRQLLRLSPPVSLEIYDTQCMRTTGDSTYAPKSGDLETGGKYTDEECCGQQTGFSSASVDSSSSDEADSGSEIRYKSFSKFVRSSRPRTRRVGNTVEQGAATVSAHGTTLSASDTVRAYAGRKAAKPATSPHTSSITPPVRHRRVSQQTPSGELSARKRSGLGNPALAGSLSSALPRGRHSAEQSYAGGHKRGRKGVNHFQEPKEGPENSTKRRIGAEQTVFPRPLHDGETAVADGEKTEDSQASSSASGGRGRKRKFISRNSYGRTSEDATKKAGKIRTPAKNEFLSKHRRHSSPSRATIPATSGLKGKFAATEASISSAVGLESCGQGGAGELASSRGKILAACTTTAAQKHKQRRKHLSEKSAGSLSGRALAPAGNIPMSVDKRKVSAGNSVETPKEAKSKKEQPTKGGATETELTKAEAMKAQTMKIQPIKTQPIKTQATEARAKKTLPTKRQAKKTLLTQSQAMKTQLMMQPTVTRPLGVEALLEATGKQEGTAIHKRSRRESSKGQRRNRLSTQTGTQTPGTVQTDKRTSALCEPLVGCSSLRAPLKQKGKSAFEQPERKKKRQQPPAKASGQSSKVPAKSTTRSRRERRVSGPQRAQKTAVKERTSGAHSTKKTTKQSIGKGKPRKQPELEWRKRMLLHPRTASRLLERARAAADSVRVHRQATVLERQLRRQQSSRLICNLFTRRLGARHEHHEALQQVLAKMRRKLSQLSMPGQFGHPPGNNGQVQLLLPLQQQLPAGPELQLLRPLQQQIPSGPQRQFPAAPESQRSTPMLQPVRSGPQQHTSATPGQEPSPLLQQEVLLEPQQQLLPGMHQQFPQSFPQQTSQWAPPLSLTAESQVLRTQPETFGPLPSQWPVWQAPQLLQPQQFSSRLPQPLSPQPPQSLTTPSPHLVQVSRSVTTPSQSPMRVLNRPPPRYTSGQPSLSQSGINGTKSPRGDAGSPSTRPGTHVGAAKEFVAGMSPRDSAITHPTRNYEPSATNHTSFVQQGRAQQHSGHAEIDLEKALKLEEESSAEEEPDEVTEAPDALCSLLDDEEACVALVSPEFMRFIETPFR